MKRITPMLTLALCLAATAAWAMTADELIEKSFEAQGGLDKMKALKSAKMTGKFLTYGMEFPFTMTQARPNNMRVDADINGQNMIQAFDGEDAWTINPMMGSVEPQDMSPMEAKGFKIQADMDGLLIDYEKKGYQVKYVGTDEVEGTAVHHLNLDTGQDMIFDMYFDDEYFLQIKTTTKMKYEENEVETDTYLSDFKEVGGLIVPHSIETRMGEQTMNTILVETVEYGMEVEDGFFTRPAKSEEKDAGSGE